MLACEKQDGVCIQEVLSSFIGPSGAGRYARVIPDQRTLALQPADLFINYCLVLMGVANENIGFVTLVGR